MKKKIKKNILTNKHYYAIIIKNSKKYKIKNLHLVKMEDDSKLTASLRFFAKKEK